MASEDVLERANDFAAELNEADKRWRMTDLGALHLIHDLAAEVRELRKARERAKLEIEKAVELIQRWGCECEPQIGFTCGPCRVVEIIDAAMGGEG